jgi:arylsulfatase
MQHAHRIIREFDQSVETESLIPPGSPVDFVPQRKNAN